jgi:DNA-binding transcriptional ArsR family regulator
MPGGHRTGPAPASRPQHLRMATGVGELRSPVAAGHHVSGTLHRGGDATADSDEELAEVLHALGDGTRLRLLPLLSSRPRTTQELARVVRLSEATVSRHLSVLRAAGLVASRREGRFVLYWLVPDRASTLSSLLLDFITGDWDGGREVLGAV